MKEESAVAKVGELMSALDQVKRYKALSKGLKQFAVLLGCTIIAYLLIRVLISILALENSVLNQPSIFFALSLISLLVVLGGLVGGALLVRRKVNSVAVGAWREDLSQGVPGALRILSEINWEATFDEISVGRISQLLYGILKSIAYMVILFFALESFSSILLIHFLGVRIFFVGVLWAFVSVSAVLALQSGDLLRRYKEGRSLDFLLYELRWFSNEYRRAESSFEA